MDSEGLEEPSVRAGVWDINTQDIKTPSALIEEVRSIEQLNSLFCSLASDERDALQDELKSITDSGRRRKVEALIATLEDEENWDVLVQSAGKAGLSRFTSVVDEWLNESVDFDEQEWFPRFFSRQGEALRFFQCAAADFADDLGVVIVEGDRPGSDYFAAELCTNIEDANHSAESLGLPIRFRLAGG